MEETWEFQDWEMLQSTGTSIASIPDSDDELSGFDGIDAGSVAVIRSDYFALNSEGQFGKKVVEGDQELGSFGSDVSSWVDPRSKPGIDVDAKRDLGFEGNEIASGNSGDLGLDFRGHRSVAGEFGEFEGKCELGSGDNAKREVGFEGIGKIEKIEVERTNSSDVWLDSGGHDVKLRGFDGKKELDYGCDARSCFDGIGIESKNSGSFLLDSGGDELVSGKFEGEKIDESDSGGVVEVGGGDGSDSVVGLVEGAEFPSRVEENGAGYVVKSSEGEKKSVVWYKLPLELLKFCVFRVSPVWSISIAAAVVGFVILRRRLYKMRRKSQSILLKVSIDDKKVSQNMIRVAGLNEAFSVVKRVPIIRSTLAGTGGVTPWPVMGLR